MQNSVGEEEGFSIKSEILREKDFKLVYTGET